MYQIITIVHIVIAFVIIALVLLQQGRGADAGAGFGAGTSTSIFGSRGSATFLSKLTSLFGALFFASSLTLTYLADKQGQAKDVITDAPVDTGRPADLPNVPAGSGVPSPSGNAVDIPIIPGAEETDSGAAQ